MFSIFLLIIFNPAHAAPLSLKDAVSHALAHSPALDSSQRQALIAESERRNAAAAFLPSVDLTATHGLARTYPSSSKNEPWVSNFSLNLLETIYDNGESIAKHKVSQLQEELSRLSLLRDRDRLLLDVAGAFFQYSLARKNLEIQQEQHAVLKLQVELVKESYRHGVKSRKDFLRFQTQLNRSDIDLLNSQTGVQKAELALKRVIGVPLESDETPEFQIEETRPSPARLSDAGVESHRDFHMAELQRRVADVTSELARRKLWPELGLITSATYGSSDYVRTGSRLHENDKVGWSALFTVKYNILDWGVRRRNSEIAAQKAEIQGNELDTQLLTLREELEKLQVDLKKLQEGFHLADDLLKLERANLALITNEYRQGKAPYLDYINSLQNFASAKSTYYGSLYDLKKGVLARRYHEGTLYEALQGK